MSYIRERQQDHGVIVEVMEIANGERVEPWKIISLDFYGYGRITPKELCDLGHWLVEQGDRIGEEYTSNGDKRQ